jgi:DNA polymerase
MQRVLTATALPLTAVPSRVPEFPDDEQRNALTADCQRCPELAESRTCISWGNGPLSADLVVVGEGPAEGDPDAEQWQGGNLTGMAYTTRHSGRAIRRMFEELGYSPADCYYTNTVKCCPTTPSGDSREPTNQERTACFHHLRTEITRIDPQVILPTGRIATETLLSFDDQELDGFLSTVLEPIFHDRLDTPLLPLLHPSYQSVWLSRLEYTREEYLTELENALTALLDP